MSQIAALKQSIRRFHDNEAGLEALQVVMIVAIAAVCLIIVNNFWEDIRAWFNGMMEAVTGEGNWSRAR